MTQTTTQRHRARNLAGRSVFLAAIALGAATLTGCAALRSVSSDVVSFGTWPADAAPGTYTFDRLPSQDKDPQRAERLEVAASHALETAGFKLAPEGAKGLYSIQLGARVNRAEPDPWSDPFWMSGYYRYGYGWGGPWPYYGGYGPYWRPWGPYPYGYGYGYGYGYPYYYDQYLREVAVLIRDTASGKPLYETRATSTGNSEGSDRLLTAMFEAALKDFPASNDRAHTVVVELPAAPQP